VTDPVRRIRALADQCVLCGLCLPHCPTYAVERLEGESPRGRIRLADALAEGRLDPADAGNWTGLDHCLGCRRCEAACPAGVQYGELLADTRALRRERLPPSHRQRLLEWTVARPAALAAGWTLLRALRPLLPRRLRQRTPEIPAHRPLAERHPAHGARRGTLGLFLGCLARRLDQPVQDAALAVLTRLGWEVRIPPAQGCCGALHRHAGAAAGEAALRAGNRQAFATHGLDAAIVSASGCFENVALALADGGPPVHELLAFIAADTELDRLALRRLPARVILHTPCTQASVVRAPGAAAALLRRIPGLDVLPTGGHGCCGAAGSQMLLDPERAARLRTPLIDAARDSAATQLLSGNIGCRLHLQAGLDAAGLPLTTRHPIELLAEALP
jgi:glycolate oxidase iron-sulfur subunit